MNRLELKNAPSDEREFNEEYFRSVDDEETFFRYDDWIPLEFDDDDLGISTWDVWRRCEFYEGDLWLQRQREDI